MLDSSRCFYIGVNRKAGASLPDAKGGPLGITPQLDGQLPLQIRAKCGSHSKN